MFYRFMEDGILMSLLKCWLFNGGLMELERLDNVKGVHAEKLGVFEHVDDAETTMKVE